jgi:lipopolysaccharide transport system ATP-binding protein
MSDTAIQVQNLSKRYRLGAAQARYQTLRESLTRAVRSIGQRSSTDENILWALRDVSFEVKQGEAVGIIGRNGAGKSTLLKILSRITKPTSGRALIHGRVGSLLEVGTGFHPELTGRENIYLNGAILGMRRAEIERKFDEIVAFSEIEKFLDTPVKFYSSGMYVRLAFAVAAHLEPEILVVDEVLAVGDAQFQKKCLGKMDQVSKGGRTVLFVSHNMGAIRQLCTRGILIEKGALAMNADVDSVVRRYVEGAATGEMKIIDHGIKKSPAVDITSIRVDGSELDDINVAAEQKSLTFEIRGIIHAHTRLAVEGRLLDNLGNPVAYFSPAHFDPSYQEQIKASPGPFFLQGEIDLPSLTQGQYFLDFYLSDPGAVGLWDFPYSVRLNTEGKPLITGGVSVLSNAKGHGVFILQGNFRLQQGGVEK